MRSAADMWRVDIAGHAITVRGEHAKEVLEKFRHQHAKMKLALHKIIKQHPEASDIAVEGLQ